MALQSNTIELTILDRKGGLVLKEHIEDTIFVVELKKFIESKTKLSAERQYLTIGRHSDDPKAQKTVLSEGYKRLNEYDWQEGGYVLTMKDIGLQVGWRTVFIVEYAGPIFVFSLLWFLSGRDHEHSSIQNLALILILIHFIKRELESCFVHVFSRDTMPFKRIFINSIHYWILCGALISVELYYFWSDPGYSLNFQYVLCGLFVLFEILNLMCHITLKNLRKSLNNDEGPYSELKTKSQRGIPEGWGFGFVTCANYWWETCVWITFAILVRCWTAYFFLALSFYQMTEWALDKHRKLKAEFNGEDGKQLYPENRKAIVPFIV